MPVMECAVISVLWKQRQEVGKLEAAWSTNGVSGPSKTPAPNQTSCPLLAKHSLVMMASLLCLLSRLLELQGSLDQWGCSQMPLLPLCTHQAVLESL